MKQIRELTVEQSGKIPAIAVRFQIHVAKPVDSKVLVQAISELLRI